MRFRFPFRRDNRRRDGSWDAPDATEDSIKGTSIDPYDPVWPRWRNVPPLDGEGDFVSDDPFFDIDEISQTAKFYPPGTPLTDRNIDGNPASRQRAGDIPSGNLWRRRLLVGRGDDSEGWPQTRLAPESDRPLVLAQAIQRNPDGTWPAPEATEENIKGTSVDRENPVWPRWTQPVPPPGESGDFISDEFFYDIDEISGRVTPYPPGKRLRDTNVDGNPGSRWRGADSVPGNPWRRRLQIWRGS
jgi:hypothetical protein